MNNLSATISEIPQGLAFHRSDGERFVLVYSAGHGLVLYRGTDTADLPPFGIAILGADVPDPRASALRHVLAYPEVAL